MPAYEGLRLKTQRLERKLFGKFHRKQLRNLEFTIISNNCWGGEVYEYYDIRKQSPTVGLFFMADDYLEFIEHLEKYLRTELLFISPKDSKWKDSPLICQDKRYGHYPIGSLSVDGKNIELFFLHYHSEEEAKQKWERRCKRINLNKLLIKFNDQNGCISDHIDRFCSIDFRNKLFFTAKHWEHEDRYRKVLQGYYFRKMKRMNECIPASYEPFGNKKDIRITDIINNL